MALSPADPPPARRRRHPGWNRLSLAVRITVAATALVGVALAVSAVLLVTTLRSGLLNSVDAAVEQRAADLSQLVARGDIPIVLPQAGDLTEAQVIGPDGAVVASTPELAGEAALVDVSSTTDGFIDGGDEEQLRLLVARSGRYSVIVASPLHEIHDVLARLSLALAVGVPLLLLVLAGIVLALVRYALRTVERLRRQVEAITATDLHRRVDTPQARDEVRALAVTMNEMLERLDRAATAQRRFVADAAHELRSPLAALQAQLEVAMRHPDAQRLTDRLPGMLEDTARLARLVDDLLALARLDEANRPHRHKLVDLDGIVFDQVAQLRHTTRVPIRTGDVSAALVLGEVDLLTRVVRNLLDNAVRYATSQVQVSLTTKDGDVVLVVSDDGPGIPPAAAEQVFRRFERLEDARDRDSGGSGLGLAIVHDAVRTSGGSVAVEPAGPGARLVVHLPAAELPDAVVRA